MAENDYAPSDEFNLLMIFCPARLRDYARTLLADCNELWADEMDTGTPEEAVR